MEIKVVCGCGQKFKFDVQPVNGRMPFPVNCPICQADGTSQANQMIAAQIAAAPNLAAVSMVSPAPAYAPVSAPAAFAAPAPAPVAAPVPVASAPPPPIAPVAAGLRINRVAHPEPAPAAAAESGSPAGVDAPPPALGAKRPFAVAAAENPPKKTSFGMGLLGGLIGALVGALVYFLIFKYTGLRFKLLAVGVGALAGWFADFLGKGEGSKELGGITAVLVLAAVVGAQYLVATSWWNEGAAERLTYAQNAYANAVTEAKGVIQVIPTGSDAEIRTYLAKVDDEDGGKAKPADITADDVKDFHDNQLPEYQSLANGQMTKAQYESVHEIKTSESKEEQDSEEGTFKAIFLLLLVTKGNIFSLIAAGALAFKLSTNA